MTGTCLCGRVRVTLAHRPDYANFCDCTLCAKVGGAWAYCDRDDLAVTGKTRTYLREDFDDPVVKLHACPVCSTTTHWTTAPEGARSRAGVNIRIFAPDQLAGIEARFLDGRNWTRGEVPAERRAAGIIGKDAFI